MFSFSYVGRCAFRGIGAFVRPKSGAGFGIQFGPPKKVAKLRPCLISQEGRGPVSAVVEGLLRVVGASMRVRISHPFFFGNALLGKCKCLLKQAAIFVTVNHKQDGRAKMKEARLWL